MELNRLSDLAADKTMEDICGLTKNRAFELGTLVFNLFIDAIENNYGMKKVEPQLYTIFTDPQYSTLEKVFMGHVASTSIRLVLDAFFNKI